LHQGLGVKYIPYKMSSKVIDWKDIWFYVKNQTPALLARTLGPPVPKPSWNSKAENLAKVHALLDKIDHLKKKKIYWSFGSCKLDVPTNPAATAASKSWIHVYW